MALALHRERYAHMSLDEYRNTIETSREPAMIEKWKEESCKQTVYKAKGVENAPALKRAEAGRRSDLAREILAGQRFHSRKNGSSSGSQRAVTATASQRAFSEDGARAKHDMRYLPSPRCPETARPART